MNINYNGQTTPTAPTLTFTDVYNILSIEQSIAGTKAELSLTVNEHLEQVTTANSQYYITILGETITNTLSPRMANNKRFYISQVPEDTAQSICRALRNCPRLAADFIITSNGDTVTLLAKTIGDKSFTNQIDRNIPTQYLDIQIVSNGSADNDDIGGGYHNSVINVDITQNDTYITQLEKNYISPITSFNVSPVLSTLTEPSKDNPTILPYTLSINKLAQNSQYTNLGTVEGYITYGYECNGSDKYLQLSTRLLSNSKQSDLCHTNYTYSNSIEYSVLARVNSEAGFSITYIVYDSALQEIHRETVQYNTPYGDMHVKDIEYIVPMQYYSQAYYIDVVYNTEVIRFNVIRPFRATEYYQRVYWRNEYNGISYFDFTGQKQQNHNLDLITYEKNIYDYYTVESFEKRKIYQNTVNQTVTLKSHLFDENGKYIFNSLINSKKLWTVVDNKVKYIIPESLSVEEDSNYNGLYTATLSYQYSYK